MLSKKENIFWICMFYATCLIFFIIGTYNDLAIDRVLFNPDNPFARFMQNYAEIPRWATWGPAAAILFATRDWESETTVKLLKAVFRKMSDKVNAVLLKIANIGYGIGFLVLGYFGWQKLIKNVVKHWFSDATKDTVTYTVVLTIVIIAVDFLAAFITRKCGRLRTLNKLKPLAYGAVVFGILYQIVFNALKSGVNRARYDEMLAVNDLGLYTPWYRHGTGGTSFPSGHTGSAAAIFLSLTLCDKLDSCKNKERLFFIISWAYTLLMAYSRMIMGRHFLTDVMMGAMLGFTFVLIVRYLFVGKFCKAIKL